MADSKKSKTIKYLVWERTYDLNSEEEQFIRALSTSCPQNPLSIGSSLNSEANGLESQKSSSSEARLDFQSSPTSEKENADSNTTKGNQKKIPEITLSPRPKEENGKSEIEELVELRLCFSSTMDVLNELLSSTKMFMGRMKELASVKTQIVSRIDEFYYESNKILSQQQIMLDLATQLDSNMVYYDTVDKIEIYVSSIQDRNVSLSNFHLNLEVFSRYLSELIDSSLFFSERPQFYGSPQILKKISELKQRILYIIKNLSVKILSRHLKYYEVFVQTGNLKALHEIIPELLQNQSGCSEESTRSSSNESRNEKMRSKNGIYLLFFLWALHPELNGIMQGVQLNEKLKASELFEYLLGLAKKEISFDSNNPSEAHSKSFYLENKETITAFWNLQQKESVDLLEPKLLSKFFYILNTLRALSVSDVDISMVYTQVKEAYYLTSRQNVNDKLIGVIRKQFLGDLEPLQQLLFVFHVVSFTEFVVQSIVFSARPGGCFALEDLEVEATKSDSRVLAYFYRFMDKIVDESRVFVMREKSIDSLVREYDYLSQFVKNHESQSSFQFIEWVYRLNQKWKKAHYDTTFTNFLNECTQRLLNEVSQRLVFLFQFFIHQNISGFNPKTGFLNEHPLAIPTTATPERYREFKTQEYPSKILSPITSAFFVAATLENRVDQEVFEQILTDSFSSCVELIINCSRMLDDRFDQFLFLTKHLYSIAFYINENLAQTKLCAIEETLDYSNTKGLIYEMISTGFPGLREKFRSSSLVETLFNGLPKLGESRNDLNFALKQTLQKVFDQNLKDFSFIVSKNLCEFIQNYEQLQELIESAKQKKDSEQEESARKDMAFHTSREHIKNVHLSFLSTVEVSLKDMGEKADVYIDGKIKEAISKNFFGNLLDNIELLLHQFFIIVSKHYDGEEYEKFGFQSSGRIQEMFENFLKPFSILVN